MDFSKFKNFDELLQHEESFSPDIQKHLRTISNRKAFVEGEPGQLPTMMTFQTDIGQGVLSAEVEEELTKEITKLLPGMGVGPLTFSQMKLEISMSVNLLKKIEICLDFIDSIGKKVIIEVSKAY